MKLKAALRAVLLQRYWIYVVLMALVLEYYHWVIQPGLWYFVIVAAIEVFYWSFFGLPDKEKKDNDEETDV